MRPRELAGQRFGRLAALRRGPRSGVRHRTTWVCRCDCGELATVFTADLTTGNTRSCGCLARELFSERKSTHGATRGRRRHRLYRIWQNMKQRCSDPNYTGYERWGGRGVTVCPEWQDFVGFQHWATESGYRAGLSIDRIDNDGNYEPSNCRWATPTEQARNRASTVTLCHAGETRPLAEWAEIVGLPYGAIKQRLKAGWTASRALTTPLRTTSRTTKEAPR